MVLLATSAILSLWFLLQFSDAGPSVLKTVVKTASVAILALAAVAYGGPMALAAALALGATGDYFLSRPGERAFLVGLVAFALSHLAYIALLLGAGAGWPGPVAYLMCAFGVVMAMALWPGAGALRLPVLGYIVVIVAMGVTALSIPAQAIIPAFLFIVSDTVLGLSLFVLRAESAFNRAAPYIIWGTYWAAQVGFLRVFTPGLSG